MEYIERFDVEKGKTKIRLAISKEPKTSIFSDGKDGFHPWAGGCGIGGNNRTLAGARLVCFEHVTSSDIKRRIADHKARLLELEYLEQTLGDDTFNLGQFKVKA